MAYTEGEPMPRSPDPHNLQRFLDAQAPVYERVLAELRAGRKRSHWIWFIFPQIHDLGSSATAQEFAIASLDEAKAYLAHPILGGRLEECSRLLLVIEHGVIQEVMGYPDDLKLRSSMTLFAHAAPDPAIFREVLQKYFDGQFDPLTVARL